MRNSKILSAALVAIVYGALLYWGYSYTAAAQRPDGPEPNPRPTHMPYPTRNPHVRFTATPVVTSTATTTATATVAATSTATATNTATATPTVANTATSTPAPATETPTSTATETNTPAPAPATSTAAPTASATYTPAVTPTPDYRNPNPTVLAAEAEMRRLINEHRVSIGLHAFEYVEALELAQRQWAVIMIAGDDCYHGDYGARAAAHGYTGFAWGEAGSCGDIDAAQGFQGWLDSPGHRGIVEAVNETQFGVGAWQYPNGRFQFWLLVGVPY